MAIQVEHWLSYIHLVAHQAMWTSEASVFVAVGSIQMSIKGQVEDALGDPVKALSNLVPGLIRSVLWS